MQHLERTIKMNAQAFISHVHAFASLFSTSQTHLSSKTTKTSPCLSPVGISGQRDTSRGRRNALKKETYRNSLRGIGLITREPVGFLLDLVRFHQRSHHFYLSILSLSLSLCLNVAFGFLFRVGCFFSKTKVLPLFPPSDKKNTDDEKEQRKKKKRKRDERNEEKETNKNSKNIERERERDHLIINTMECYFFVPTVRKIQTNAQKLNIAHDSTSKCLHLLLLLPFIHPLLDHVQPKQTL